MTTLQDRRTAALQTPSTFSENAVKDLASSLTALLADCFALYLKTKNFHWHMSGPHFRDHHLELRAAQSSGADALPAAGGLQWRVVARSHVGDLWR